MLRLSARPRRTFEVHSRTLADKGTLFLDGRLAMRRGFRCADEPDQLLVRTGEAARKQTPLNCTKKPGVTDRYLPGRSLIRFL